MYPNEKYPSQTLREAVEAIGSLPGVGSRSALRLALHLLGQPAENIRHFASAIGRLADDVHWCRTCQMIADGDECAICADRSRDHRTICVVESVRDVMSIEATGQYRGVYHVLGGIISPIDGIGPSDIHIRELLARLGTEEVNEVILATNPDVEGEATATYIARLLKPMNVKCTRIAHGVPVGGDLEYTDEVTLFKALEGRRDM